MSDVDTRRPDPSLDPALGRAGWLIVLQVGTYVALSMIVADGRTALLAGALFIPFIAWQMGKAAQARGRSAWLYGLMSLATPLAIFAYQRLRLRGLMLSMRPAAENTRSGDLHLSWWRFGWMLAWFVVVGLLVLWGLRPDTAVVAWAILLVSFSVISALMWRRMRAAYAADPAITLGALARTMIGPAWWAIAWVVGTVILCLASQPVQQLLWPQ